MTYRILRSPDHRRMPWKNGRGETTEIAVHPAGASIEDFGWRVSMAGVTEDGDFSLFPGIDRTLAVLTGAGIALQVQGQGLHRLTPQAAPLAFPADVPSAARLISGPITDLNVMTRRGAFAHRLAALDASPAPGPAPDWRLLLATDHATLDFAGQTIALAPHDVLLCDSAEPALPLRPAPGLWSIQIFRL